MLKVLMITGSALCRCCCGEKWPMRPAVAPWLRSGRAQLIIKTQKPLLLLRETLLERAGSVLPRAVAASLSAHFSLPSMVLNSAQIRFLYSVWAFSLPRAKKIVEPIYSEVRETVKNHIMDTYLLSRIGVGDRQLWLIKYLIWSIIDYCSLIFNLNNLYTMLHHGGDAELT